MVSLAGFSYFIGDKAVNNRQIQRYFVKKSNQLRGVMPKKTTKPVCRTKLDITPLQLFLTVCFAIGSSYHRVVAIDCDGWEAGPLESLCFI